MINPLTWLYIEYRLFYALIVIGKNAPTGSFCATIAAALPYLKFNFCHTTVQLLALKEQIGCCASDGWMHDDRKYHVSLRTRISERSTWLT